MTTVAVPTKNKALPSRWASASGAKMHAFAQQMNNPAFDSTDDKDDLSREEEESVVTLPSKISNWLGGKKKPTSDDSVGRSRRSRSSSKDTKEKKKKRRSRSLSVGKLRRKSLVGNVMEKCGLSSSSLADGSDSSTENETEASESHVDGLVVEVGVDTTSDEKKKKKSKPKHRKSDKDSDKKKKKREKKDRKKKSKKSSSTPAASDPSLSDTSKHRRMGRRVSTGMINIARASLSLPAADNSYSHVSLGEDENDNNVGGVDCSGSSKKEDFENSISVEEALHVEEPQQTAQITPNPEALVRVMSNLAAIHADLTTASTSGSDTEKIDACLEGILSMVTVVKDLTTALDTSSKQTAPDTPTPNPEKSNPRLSWVRSLSGKCKHLEVQFE